MLCESIILLVCRARATATVLVETCVHCVCVRQIIKLSTSVINSVTKIFIYHNIEQLIHSFVRSLFSSPPPRKQLHKTTNSNLPFSLFPFRFIHAEYIEHVEYIEYRQVLYTRAYCVFLGNGLWNLCDVDVLVRLYSHISTHHSRLLLHTISNIIYKLSHSSASLHPLGAVEVMFLLFY